MKYFRIFACLFKHRTSNTCTFLRLLYTFVHFCTLGDSQRSKVSPACRRSHLDQWNPFCWTICHRAPKRLSRLLGLLHPKPSSPSSNKFETIQCSKGMAARASLSASKFMNRRLSGLLAAGVPIWSTINVSFPRRISPLLTWKMLRSHSIRYSWIFAEIYTSDKAHYLGDRSPAI